MTKKKLVQRIEETSISEEEAARREHIAEIARNNIQQYFRTINIALGVPPQKKYSNGRGYALRTASVKTPRPYGKKD